MSSASTAFGFWMTARLRNPEAALRVVHAARSADPSALDLVRAWLKDGGLSAVLTARGGDLEAAERLGGVLRVDVVAALRHLIHSTRVRIGQIESAQVGDLVSEQDSDGDKSLGWNLRACGRWPARQFILANLDLAAVQTLARYGRAPAVPPVA